MLWPTIALVVCLGVVPRLSPAGLPGPASRLADLLRRRQASTFLHGRRVADAAAAVAQRLGYADERLRMAATLHDIGKLDVDANILDKPGPLTAEEYESVRKHSEAGAACFLGAGLTTEAVWIRAHHEWLDGSGYPDGLRGDEIPLASRIIAVVDAFDAMVHDGRSYRPALTRQEAADELVRCAGTQFDPVVVAAFLEVCLAGERS